MIINASLSFMCNIGPLFPANPDLWYQITSPKLPGIRLVDFLYIIRFWWFSGATIIPMLGKCPVYIGAIVVVFSVITHYLEPF